jgi:DNA polymerase (family X)
LPVRQRQEIQTLLRKVMMTNLEIANIFRDIAVLLEKKKENWFKIRAYRKVAEEIGKLTVHLSQLASENKLREIPGVGEAIEKKINEMLTTGQLQFYEKLKSEAGADTDGQIQK